MKRMISFIAALLMAAGTSFAQMSVEKLTEEMGRSRLNFDMSVKEMNFSVLYQSKRFVLSAKDSDTKIICDSHNIYVVDYDAKEVSIESAAPVLTALNPGNIRKAVRTEKAGADFLEGVVTNPDDPEEEFSFSLKKIRISEADKDSSPFTFSVKGLDKTWVVNDLR